MSPAYRASHDVGVTVSDGRVYLAHLPGGPLLVLEGAAAAIWTEATTGPAQGWVGRVARAFGEPEDHVADDVKRFVADLEARGIAEAVDGAETDDVG
jgi:Coenzyme PQQ synthesis protein D (PqqD)